MLKRVSPHGLSLDGDWTLEYAENAMVVTLDAYQIGVNTDEELKKNCYPLLKSWANSKNMTVDEFYDYVVKKYPYCEDYSRWGYCTEQELQEYNGLYRFPMRKG